MFDVGFKLGVKNYYHSLIPQFQVTSNSGGEVLKLLSAQFCTYYPFNGSNESEQSHQEANNAKSPKQDPLGCPWFNIALTQIHFHWEIYGQWIEDYASQNSQNLVEVGKEHSNHSG